MADKYPKVSEVIKNIRCSHTSAYGWMNIGYAIYDELYDG